MGNAVAQQVFELETKYFLERPWFLRPTRVRILIVTDGSGSFDSTASFGLGLAIAAMRSDPWWWTRFDITTAHRTTGTPSADATVEHHDNFRFDALPAGLSLDDFDQIWLFGVLRAGASPLSNAEIAVVRGFMDSGGGVFATGDHEDLGASLSSELPRIREMRKWKAGGPAGTPPPQSGFQRHDTVREGPTPGYQFNDQSDAVPQQIQPRLYPLWSGFPWQARSAPHPVLCGRNGIIRVLPDHMHEGHIVRPASVAGASDWPNGLGPDVIAWATVIPHTNTDGHGPVQGRSFGVLGAYDGHRENVGRIVVDATWHHWFNINLLGFPAGSTDYADIKNYFWNVGLWLARPATIESMFNRVSYGILWSAELIELSPKTPLAVLGAVAHDAIGKRASRCTVREWLYPRFPIHIREAIVHLPIPEPDPPFRGPHLYEEFTIGGITQRLLEEYSPLDPPKTAPSERVVAALVDEGIARGWKAYARFEHDSAEHMREFFARIDRPNQSSRA